MDAKDLAARFEFDANGGYAGQFEIDTNGGRYLIRERRDLVIGDPVTHELVFVGVESTHLADGNPHDLRRLLYRAIVTKARPEPEAFASIAAELGAIAAEAAQAAPRA